MSLLVTVTFTVFWETSMTNAVFAAFTTTTLHPEPFFIQMPTPLIKMIFENLSMSSP